MAFSILPILFIILLLVGLIVGIILWITGGKSKGSGEMSCGSCGYAVRGLAGLNCPECGADLRLAGINRPKGTTSRNVSIALTIGTGLLLLTCMGSMLLWVSGSSSSIQAVPTQLNQPGVNQPTTIQPLQADPPEIEVEDSEDSTDETDR